VSPHLGRFPRGNVDRANRQGKNPKSTRGKRMERWSYRAGRSAHQNDTRTTARRRAGTIICGMCSFMSAAILDESAEAVKDFF